MKTFFFLFLMVCFSNTYSQEFLDEYNIYGKVTSGNNAQGISGASIKYIQITPDSSLVETFSNAFGDYSFTISDVEDFNHSIFSSISYNSYNSKPVVELKMTSADVAVITVVDILGQEVHKQRNDLTAGLNSIIVNIPEVASANYFTRVQTSEKIYVNKLQVPFNNWGSNPNVISKTATRLKKITETSFRMEFRDLTETHHPYLIKEWDPEILEQDKEYSTPLLPKKDLDIPFTNPRNGQPVTNTREMLFFARGVDYLIYSAYQPRVRPLLTHLNIQELPPQYNEQDVRDATLEMLTATKLPLDTVLVQRKMEFGVN